MGWVLVGEHPTLPTLGVQCLAPSGGTIASVIRGNIFLRHFGYADIWHVSFCECACQLVVKGWHTPTTSILGPTSKGNPPFFTCSCTHLKQYYSDWLGHLLPTWQLMAGYPSRRQPGCCPVRTGCLSDPSAGSRAVLRASAWRVRGSFWFFLVLFKGGGVL